VDGCNDRFAAFLYGVEALLDVFNVGSEAHGNTGWVVVW